MLSHDGVMNHSIPWRHHVHDPQVTKKPVTEIALWRKFGFLGITGLVRGNVWPRIIVAESRCLCSGLSARCF